MATLLSSIETQVRRHLNEATAKYWSSAEMVDIINKGIKDLWRDVVDLKQEHFLTRDVTNVSLAANTSTLTGVPADVHKVYLIEPRDPAISGSNYGLMFRPMDYNHKLFQFARTMDDIEPNNAVIYYAIYGAGAPPTTPTVYVAPQVTSAVNLAFIYVPTLADLTASGNVPIPGEADNALIAWTVAFARAKELDMGGPDPNWLAIYATEKAHLLQSLGMREYAENKFSEAIFEEYWG